MYILFEGIDTCGKSTQMELIADRYPSVITTFEPGATEFGIEARKMLLSSKIHSKKAEFLLFLADRAEHYHEVIAPNIDKTIISDRGFLSGVGYALANGDIPFEELMRLNSFALDDNLPDKIILFVTNMDTLRQRIGNKGLDGIEQRGLEYLLRVQEYMKTSLKRLNIDFTIVDATQSIDTVYEEIESWLML